MTTATIVSPNPMPSDIDWARVESVLGVRIIQGAPSTGDSFFPSRARWTHSVANVEPNGAKTALCGYGWKRDYSEPTIGRCPSCVEVAEQMWSS